MRFTNTLKLDDKLFFGPARNQVLFVRYDPSDNPVVRYERGGCDFACAWHDLHRPGKQKEQFKIGDRVRYTGYITNSSKKTGTVTQTGQDTVDVCLDGNDYDTPFNSNTLVKLSQDGPIAIAETKNSGPQAWALAAATAFDSNTCGPEFYGLSAFPISSKDTTTMKTPIKIENRTFITLPGQAAIDASNFTDDQLIAAIQEGENEIKRLNAIEHKPKTLDKRIEDLKAGIDNLVTFMDNRPPQK
jgi:hypothetical protein